MERRETTEQAVLREVAEESGAVVRPGALFSVFDVPHMSQLYVVFRAEVRSPALSPGEECLDAGLFEPGEIPWSRLSYPVIGNILRRWLAEREAVLEISGNPPGASIVVDARYWSCPRIAAPTYRR